MQLALVKPKPKLDDSIAFFQAHGVAAVGVAPMDIQLVEQGIVQLYAALETPVFFASCIIVTSTESAKVLARAMTEKKLQGNRVFCVGDASAATLNNHFAQCIVPEQQTSEGLLSTLSAYSDISDSISLIKGIGGRTTLKTTLESQNKNVINYDVYQRIALGTPYIPTPFSWQSVDIIMATSESLLDALLQAFPDEQLEEKLWIVPSERINQLAKAKGLKEIITSRGATNRHLLGCVQALQRGRT